MLVEPPGPHVPAGPGLNPTPHRRPVRVAAAAAVLVLAVLSRGDAVVLAALLVVAAWRPVTALAVVPALVAASLALGIDGAGGVAGAQAVLGPAGWVGPTRSAAGSLAGRRRARAPARSGWGWGHGGRLGRALVPRTGGGRGCWCWRPPPARPLPRCVAGPAPGGQLWVRAVATAVGTVVALAVGRVRSGRAGASRALDGLGAGCGLLALMAVSGGAPAWRGTVDIAALRVGAVLALAVAAAVAVGSAAVGALGARAQ